MRERFRCSPQLSRLRITMTNDTEIFTRLPQIATILSEGNSTGFERSAKRVRTKRWPLFVTFRSVDRQRTGYLCRDVSPMENFWKEKKLLRRLYRRRIDPTKNLKLAGIVADASSRLCDIACTFIEREQRRRMICKKRESRSSSTVETKSSQTNVGRPVAIIFDATRSIE